MTMSMTGFATLDGRQEDWSWTWDLRAVNGRGLDLRLRLPDWIDGLEAQVRARLSASISRGNVTCGLKIQRPEASAATALNETVLNDVLAQIAAVEAAATAAGVTLAQTRAADILATRGVLDANVDDALPEGFLDALLTDLDTTLAHFNAMRGSEGAALEEVLTGQLASVDGMVTAAEALLTDRSGKMEDTFRGNIAKIIENTDAIDEDRIAQELATLAIKSDVAEEIDRLRGHVAAAHEILASDAPKGRKLDFLTQEFNREANTLCSKAQFAELTRIGLDLKHVIDQMREQVQNVE